MPKDIIEGRIVTDSVARIASEHVERLSKHKLKPGDIVYGRRGDIGRQALIRKEQEGWLCGTGCLRLSLSATVIEPLFLHYYLRQESVISWISNQAVGATLPNLNTGILRSVPVRVPPLPVQRRIAGILSAYDELIENNQRRIKILEEMARSLYREWFVHFRFPGHEKVKMASSPLGPIPQGWEVLPLETVCERITDGAHHSPKSVEGGFPMASVKDMQDWGFNLESCRQISQEDYKSLVRNDCRPKKGDILIAKDGSYLKHTFVVGKEQELVILSSIAMLRPNERIHSNYLNFILRSVETKARMKGFVSGVALPRIILKDFRNFQIIVAPHGLQAKWSKYVDPMVESCRHLTAMNENLRRTRDLLFPRLLSGQVSLSC